MDASWIKLVFILPCLFCASMASAGTGYEVTAKDKEGKEVTYQVNFGGAKLFEQYTAFDPDSKTFVYLQWNRREKPPQPVSVIFNHVTGEMIPLYQFPEAKHPLPVIPSMEAMKVCPITGDKEFKAVARIAYD
jgi:hypothetical protein